MGTEPTTLNELFRDAVKRAGESEFLRFKVSGEWQSLTFNEVAENIRVLALGLHDLNFQAGDKLAIWSENCPEWNLADLATLAIGGIDIPIYATQTRNQVEFILKDSGARAIFVSETFLQDALELKQRVGSLDCVIVLRKWSILNGDQSSSDSPSLVERGHRLGEHQPGLYEKLWQAVEAEDTATLLYTSGTTGDPKGVVLTHKNLTTNALNSYHWLYRGDEHDIALTYLPFTHIFERSVWYLYAHSGTVIVYAESIDAVARNLLEARPTVMTSVPRMFEKIYAKIVERGMAAGFPRKQIFAWSLGIGKQWAERKDRGQTIGLLLTLEHKIADKLVFVKWRDVMGGRIRLFISGGASLAPEIAYLFAGAGLSILQGYGLTETSPSISCNTIERNRIGTVGPVMDNVQVQIASDGEILVKGDTVMTGYYNRPAENERAFTDDGWFKTGDIGHIDSDGFLVITDRKKDLIKTSGGKYVAPQQLESLIKSSRFVSQVVVVGNGRKFVSALIVPNMEMLKNYADLKGIAYSKKTDLTADPLILDLMERQVDKFTPGLARFEKVKKVILLDHELTVEAEELTPTLKPRRNVIEKKYEKLIDRVYDDTRAAVAV